MHRLQLHRNILFVLMAENIFKITRNLRWSGFKPHYTEQYYFICEAFEIITAGQEIRIN